MLPEWWTWKYDLCENEIHCEGRSIGYADRSIFEIKDKEEFGHAIRALSMKLGWLIERANLAPELLEILVWARQTFHQAHHYSPIEDCKMNTCQAMRAMIDKAKVPETTERKP